MSSTQKSDALAPVVPVSGASPMTMALPTADGEHRRRSVDLEVAVKSHDPAGRPSVDNITIRLSVDGFSNRLEKDGLSSVEAARRLQFYGPNALDKKKTGLLMQLFQHFIHGPMQYLILVAAIISGAIQHWVDFVIMWILLVANGSLSFIEAKKSSDALSAIESSLAQHCLCFRDGEMKEREARLLVPGDKILLNIGGVVPADCIYVGRSPLTVDESALTGETIPVTKRSRDEVKSGSVIKTGQGEAYITKTGKNSFIGKSATLVNQTEKRSTFTRMLNIVLLVMVVVSFTFVIIILGVRLGRGNSFGTVLQLVVVVLVASIPVAMPVVVTSTLAVGARKLAAHNVIVSRLSAIEELAGMDILCSDKTGTLTKNQLTIRECLPSDGFSERDCVLWAALAVDPNAPEAIDRALTGKATSEFANLLNSFELGDFVPFDPIRKRADVHARDTNGDEWIVTKGAVSALLAISPLSEQERKDWEDRVLDFALQGLRCLGVMRKAVPVNKAHVETEQSLLADESVQAPGQGENAWQFIGMVTLVDPLRDDTAATVERAGNMGVKVKMITGDHEAVAKQVCRELGLTGTVHTRDFFDRAEGRTAEGLCRDCESADAFAQVYPEHKFKVVEALQGGKHCVGMTGDGVNDAPALKRADVGIAVQGATDAARAAADLVLLDPGLSVIITAIERSRKIFHRMVNYMKFRIAATLQILIFTWIAVLFLNNYGGSGGDFDMPALLLVIITLLSDGSNIAMAYDNVDASDMPEHWDFVDILIVAGVVGGLGIVEVYLLHAWASNQTVLYASVAATEMSDGILKSIIFLGLGVSGYLTTFTTRTHRFFFSRRPGWTLLLSVLGAVIVQLILAVYWPFGETLEGCGWRIAGITIGYSFLCFVIKDIVKVFVNAMIAFRPFATHGLSMRIAGQ